MVAALAIERCAVVAVQAFGHAVSAEDVCEGSDVVVGPRAVDDGYFRVPGEAVDDYQEV